MTDAVDASSAAEADAGSTLLIALRTAVEQDSQQDGAAYAAACEARACEEQRRKKPSDGRGEEEEEEEAGGGGSGGGGEAQVPQPATSLDPASPYYEVVCRRCNVLSSLVASCHSP